MGCTATSVLYRSNSNV